MGSWPYRRQPLTNAPEQAEAGWDPAFAMLIKTINGRRSRRKEAAIIMLGELRDRRAVQPLLDLLSRERKTLLRGRVITALGRIGGKESRPTLRAIVKSENEREWIRACARAALGLKEKKKRSYRSSRFRIAAMSVVFLTRPAERPSAAMPSAIRGSPG